MVGQKGLAGYIQGPKREEPAAKILYPARLPIRIGERKSFQDRQKLKEYVTIKPALQEILRETVKERGGPRKQSTKTGTE